MHLHSHAHGSPTAPPPSKKRKAAGRSARLPAARPRPLPVLAGTALGVSDAVGGSGSLPDGPSDRPAGWQRPAVLPRAEYEPGRLLGPLSLACDALPFRGTSGWPRWDGGQPPRRGASRTAPGSAASHPPGAPTATAWRAPSSERRCPPHGSPRGPAPRPGGRSQGAGHRPAGNRNRARVSASRPRGHRGRRRVSLPTAKAPFPCREGRVSPAPGTQAQGRLRPAFSHVSSPQPAGRCGSGRDGFWDIWRTSGLTQRSPTFVAPGADVGQACASGRTAGGGAEAPAPSPRSSTGARLPSACRCGRGTRGAGHTGRARAGNAGCGEHRVCARAAAASPQAPPPRARSPHVLSAARA